LRIQNSKFKIVLLALLLTSCGPSHNLTKAVPANKEMDMAGLVKAVSAAAPDYKWLQMSSSMSYAGQDQKYDAGAVIKMRKDSIIWASVSVLFEIARALVNNDSTSIMYRLQKQYSVFPNSSLQNMLAIQNLTMPSFQRLLLAYPPFGLNENYKFTKQENSYLVQNTTPLYQETITLDASMMRMTQYTYAKNETQKIIINYSNFEKNGNNFFPKKIGIEVHSPDVINISLDVNSYTLSDKDEAPFKIPASYKKQ